MKKSIILSIRILFENSGFQLDSRFRGKDRCCGSDRQEENSN
ncbi:MAG: hypothetical protein OXJ52_10000 [Oligoflexia bacterium]|nr:hypothetical protein [Oligoflexia bacterium]